MWRIPAGIWTCGILSTEETRCVLASDVGEAAVVGVAVLTMVAAVEAGIAVDEASVGIGVDAAVVAGICGAVHAVRRNRERITIFFIGLWHCDENRWLSSVAGAYRNHKWLADLELLVSTACAQPAGVLRRSPHKIKRVQRVFITWMDGKGFAPIFDGAIRITFAI